MEFANMKTETGVKNPEILSLMLCRLRSHGLITKEEKLKLGRKTQFNDIKIALFDMLLEKDVVVSSKMFLAIRSVKLENDGRPNQLKMTRNPMQSNNKIIKNVIKFLELKDVKNCRLINKVWSDIAGPLVRKRSMIVFGSDVDEDDIKRNRNPSKFLETYARPSLRKSFDSFRFETGSEWHVSDLKNFFEQQKNNIKELILDEVGLIGKNGQVLENYDISDWLVGSALTKLRVCCDSSTTISLSLALSLDRIPSVIHLDNCVVKIKELPAGSRISPVSFAINDVTWQFDNGENCIDIDEFRLNDFIDFRRAKFVKINALECNEVIFDISECLDVKRLLLRNEVAITNWNRAKGTVGSFVMSGVPFMEKTEMRINELHFADASIDLFALPWAIETLHLGWGTTVFCSQPITLPNLKFLEINNINHLEILNNFINCTNLVDIHIVGTAHENSVLNVNWIPKSVKQIKIEKVRIVGSTLNLETLVLTWYSLFDTFQILSVIKPKVVALKWQKNFESNDSVLEVLRQFRNLILYIGPFYWDGERYPSFETSKLVTYVDRKTSYYVFENNRGKGIDCKRFDAMYCF